MMFPIVVSEGGAVEAVEAWSTSDAINFDDCFLDDAHYWRTYSYRLVFPNNELSYSELGASKLVDVILGAPCMAHIARIHHIKFLAVLVDRHTSMIQISVSRAVLYKSKMSMVDFMNAILPEGIVAVHPDPTEEREDRMNDVLNRAPMHAIRFLS